MSYTKGPRYLIEPSGGGADQIPSREIQQPAYAATAALKTTQEKTVVQFALLTGALSLTIDTTAPYVNDELIVVLPADVTGRTVTFSTGFTPVASTIVLGSNAVGVVRFIFDAVTQTWVEASRTTSPVTSFTTITADTVNEVTANHGVLIDGALIKDGVLFSNPTAAAINSTATATAAQIVGGLITSTSAAATAITTPTAAAILALITGGGAGTELELVIDNSAGANTVTLTLDASITAPAGAITGGNTLTITTTHKVGVFRIYFTSPTAAVIYRIA